MSAGLTGRFSFFLLKTGEVDEDTSLGPACGSEPGLVCRWVPFELVAVTSAGRKAARVPRAPVGLLVMPQLSLAAG